MEPNNLTAMADELKQIGGVLVSSADPRFADYQLKKRIGQIADELKLVIATEK